MKRIEDIRYIAGAGLVTGVNGAAPVTVGGRFPVPLGSPEWLRAVRLAYADATVFYGRPDGPIHDDELHLVGRQVRGLRRLEVDWFLIISTFLTLNPAPETVDTGKED